MGESDGLLHFCWSENTEVFSQRILHIIFLNISNFAFFANEKLKHEKKVLMNPVCSANRFNNCKVFAILKAFF